MKSFTLNHFMDPYKRSVQLAHLKESQRIMNLYSKNKSGHISRHASYSYKHTPGE